MTEYSAGGNAYDDHGDGDDAFLFLPGWCGPRTIFEPITDRLSADRRTLALDWRGHGESKPASSDFGTAELVEDALSVIEESGVRTVVPVAAAHAGWVAIELRRRLGADRVPGLVFLDWMVLGAPTPFLGALAGMADPASTRAVVDQVTAMWLGDLDLPALTTYVASMAANPDEMWARAGREIAAQFDRFGAPLDAVATLDPAPPTLHLYAQPTDPAFLDAQRQLAAATPWFQVEKLDARSHFPIFEVPDTIADHLRRFGASVA
jgi:pimeloyl-ACP methyl ester carboxylesterase